MLRRFDPHYHVRRYPAVLNHGRQRLCQVAENGSFQLSCAVFDAGALAKQPCVSFAGDFRVERPFLETVLNVTLKIIELLI